MGVPRHVGVAARGCESKSRDRRHGVVIGTVFGAVVSSAEKRVIGQQQAIGVRDLNEVWDELKNGVDTSSR